MGQDDDLRGIMYETLIRTAFDKGYSDNNGASKAILVNTIMAERGERYSKHLGSFEEQFGNVKKYTSGALMKLTNTKPYSEKAELFQSLIDKLDQTISTDELSNLINEALDELIPLRPQD